MRSGYGLFLALAWLVHAAVVLAAPPDTSAPTEPSIAARPAPSRLVITVVTNEAALPTLEQRVSSWFSDGTQVTVRLASNVTPELLLSASPGEVRVCVVPRGPQRALVTFATPEADASRHLLRDVHLHDGFDEIGLERLASVIHGACLALREGVEGAVRADAERALTEQGLLAPQSASPAAAAAPSIVPALAHSAVGRPEPRHVGWSLGAEYGARLRGGEGLGHGPGALLGLQLPSVAGTIDIALRAQVLLGSAFEAGPLTVSLQTTALRAELGMESALGKDVVLQTLLGGGVDAAHIRPSEREASADDELRILAREPGTQWRGAGELSLGIIKRTPRVDFGVFARCSFLLGDVHYTLARTSGEERLVTPWPVQPALTLSARFWGPL